MFPFYCAKDMEADSILTARFNPDVVYLRQRVTLEVAKVFMKVARIGLDALRDVLKKVILRQL